MVTRSRGTLELLEKGMAQVIWYLLTALFAYFSVPILLPIYQAQMKQNYLGEMLPTGLGTAFIIPAVLVLITSSRGQGWNLWFSLLLLLFSLFGILDDALGGEQKGFRGHFSQRTLSTGALKALGGGLSSLAIASLFGASWLDVMLNAAIIALSANLLNLLDLRPGRAGKVFLLLGLPFFFISGEARSSLGSLLFAVAGYLPWDLKRKVMMGDTGSNPLGAILGFVAALHLPLVARAILLALLISLHILAERVSFSKIIASNRFLHFLDQLGR